MAVVEMTPDKVEMVVRSKHLSAGLLTALARPSYLKYQQLTAQVTVGPYLVSGGQPTLDTGYGVNCSSTVYTDAGGITKGIGFPSPAAAVTGATWRFLPSATYTGVVSGKTRWFPVGGSIATYPNLNVNKQTAVEDPAIESAYSYESSHVRVSRPAYCMNTTGYFELLTGNGTEVNYAQATLVMVLVPHNGPGAFYPLYDGGKSTATGRRFSMVYRKGSLEVWLGHSRLFAYQVVLDHHEPIIVAFSYDATTKVGRMVVADRRRCSRTFNVNGLSGMDMNAFIGVSTLNAGSNTPDLTKIADMDILEIDIWLNTALNQIQLESVVHLLAAVYGIRFA